MSPPAHDYPGIPISSEENGALPTTAVGVYRHPSHLSDDHTPTASDSPIFLPTHPPTASPSPPAPSPSTPPRKPRRAAHDNPHTIAIFDQRLACQPWPAIIAHLHLMDAAAGARHNWTDAAVYGRFKRHAAAIARRRGLRGFNYEDYMYLADGHPRAGRVRATPAPATAASVEDGEQGLLGAFTAALDEADVWSDVAHAHGRQGGDVVDGAAVRRFILARLRVGDARGAESHGGP